MNMVMTHEFEHAFVKKMRERQTIENELDRIADYQQKNARHNVYLTRGQILRNQKTLGEYYENNKNELEDSWHTENKVPKKIGFKALLNTIGSPQRTQSASSPGQSIGKKSSVHLPPLKLKSQAQESEVMKLIQKNMNKDKKAEKMGKGDFAKKYATIEKSNEVAPERFHGSELVNQAEAKIVEKL